MSVKVTGFELENVKRVRTVAMKPAERGLTVIGGKNKQGKTSVLTALQYAVGGERYRPSDLQRRGGMAPAKIDVMLSNGLHVLRAGKNAALKVVDENGIKSGQRLLDSFIEPFALNIKKFLDQSAIEKKRTLLRIIGCEDALESLEKAEKEAYDNRHAAGVIADQKKKFAAEMIEYHDVPEMPLSAGELVAESQAILQRNAERQAARDAVVTLERNVAQAKQVLSQKTERVAELEKMLEAAKNERADASFRLSKCVEALDVAKSKPIDSDESTAKVKAKIDALEEINAKIRANLDKAAAEDAAAEAVAEWRTRDAELEAVRTNKMKLLDGAEMPLAGLSIGDNGLTYKGIAWDCMSEMERMRVAVAIVEQLNPQCGFVLLDGLERFDREQMAEFCKWLEVRDLQGIATRVTSDANDCTILIEDGMVVTDTQKEEQATEQVLDEDGDILF